MTKKKYGLQQLSQFLDLRSAGKKKRVECRLSPGRVTSISTPALPAWYQVEESKTKSTGVTVISTGEN